jgi:seryl-tRNA synthetase
MLNDRLLREHPEVVRAGLRRRHAGDEAERALDRWVALDAQRRATATRAGEFARSIAAARRELKAEPDSPGTAEMRARQRRRQAVEDALVVVEAQQRAAALQLPNLPDPRVPDGGGPAESIELRRWGEPPTLDFPPRRHDELAADLGLLDLPRATKLAGARFPLLVGAGARLARALAAFMLDLHAARAYLEVAPPHLLRRDTLEGTGHLPRYEDELYALPRDDLFLSPTAEVQLVALHAGETLPASNLPLAYTAVTPAFRREAGSAGAVTRGLLRQHQFDKVELVRVTTPEEADAAFETLLADAEAVLRRLELPYRVVVLCAGELPFAAQRTYDLEVWMAGMGRYVEISSISDCGPFQARRLNLRYRTAASARARHPHTLNGSALAIGRTIAALLENGQRADGSVTLPAVLQPFIAPLALDRQPV